MSQTATLFKSLGKSKMHNHINAWQPDTCGCELHYQFDDTLPAEGRVHVPIHEYTDVTGNVRTTKHCLLHSGLTPDELHDHVTKENVTKNRVHGHLMENHPHLAEKFQWTFSGRDHNRVLEVSFGDHVLTSEETASIEAHAQTLHKPVKLV
jgi:hypothetical protein